MEKHFLSVKLGDTIGFAFMISVHDLISIHYVAQRGRDDEPGAVQRVLSTVRIKSIEDYILKGNTFYTPFFVNWTNSANPLIINTETSIITIPEIAKSAQILDGQHRIEGLKRAVEKDSSIGDQEVFAILTNGLETKDAAKIFLNINTEQRPVQKSLIYDLFGLVNEDNPEVPEVRAKDLANELNSRVESPYFNQIKMPGNPRGFGAVDLSSVVSALKEHLANRGSFLRYKLVSLEIQTTALMNFFTALKKWYDEDGLWNVKSKNPFMTNAGFLSAIEVFARVVIPKCADKSSFEVTTIYEILNLDRLLLQNDIKNMDGKTQRKTIADYLEKCINSNLPSENGYKF